MLDQCGEALRSVIFDSTRMLQTLGFPQVLFLDHVSDTCSQGCTELQSLATAWIMTLLFQILYVCP